MKPHLREEIIRRLKNEIAILKFASDPVSLDIKLQLELKLQDILHENSASDRRTPPNVERLS